MTALSRCEATLMLNITVDGAHVPEDNAVKRVMRRDSSPSFDKHQRASHQKSFNHQKRLLPSRNQVAYVPSF